MFVKPREQREDSRFLPTSCHGQRPLLGAGKYYRLGCFTMLLFAFFTSIVRSMHSFRWWANELSASGPFLEEPKGLMEAPGSGDLEARLHSV